MTKDNRTIYFLIFISTLPFLWLFTQSKILGGPVYAFANICGLIGILVLFWQMVLGVRPVIKNFTKNYASTIKIHKILGKYGVLFILVHPFLESYNYVQNLVLSLPDISTNFGWHIFIGKIAFVSILTTWITSAIIRSKIKFRPWIYIHYLNYPIMFFVFVHAREIGTFVNTMPLIKIYFYLIILGYLFILALKSLAVLNLDKSQAKLINIKKYNDNLYNYYFQNLSPNLSINPGQFFYIKTHFFGESHPFSVTEFNKNKMVFGIKAAGKFTNSLPKLNKGRKIYLEGPYGKFTKEGQNDKPKILIAGGIGITPFVELIKQFGNKNTYLFYSNKYLENAIYRSELKKILDNNYFDFITQENAKGKNIINNRISFREIKKIVDPKFLKQTNFFICGSPGFNNEIKKILLNSGIDNKNIFIEDFGF